MVVNLRDLVMSHEKIYSLLYSPYRIESDPLEEDRHAEDDRRHNRQHDNQSRRHTAGHFSVFCLLISSCHYGFPLFRRFYPAVVRSTCAPSARSFSANRS